MKKLLTALISAAVLTMPLALVSSPAAAQAVAPATTQEPAVKATKAKKVKSAKKSTKAAKAKAAKAAKTAKAKKASAAAAK